MSRSQWWASFGIRDHDTAIGIRDLLWERLGRPHGYERVEPHITIHPGFTVGGPTAAHVAGTIARHTGARVRLGPVHYWPSPEEPMVVKLSVETRIMRSLQTKIDQIVRANGGTIDKEPVPAHLTLFKSGDTGEEPDGLINKPVAELAEATDGVGDLETAVDGFRMKRRS